MAPIPRTNAGGNRRRWRGMPEFLTGFQPWPRSTIRLAVPLMISMLVTGCSMFDSINQTLFGGGPTPGQQGYVKGFLGEIVADEPRAALVGKEVLSGGGNAADAAVAVGLSLAVTLPSRAGLGGGGACIAYAPDTHLPAHGYPEAITFVSPPGE